MPGVSGSIKRLILDGVSYNVPGDVNITEVNSQYEVTDVPTSGGSLKKMVRRTETRENVVVIASSQEQEDLKELSERVVDFPMSYELADGSVYRTTGFIALENRDTEEYRATLKLFPRDSWELFS